MYQLPGLPYEYNALEPVISEKIMRLHHDKHHATYITNVNKALAGTGYEEKPIEEVLKNVNSLPENIRTTVRNHGGGHANHSLFWEIMAAPTEHNVPTGTILQKITQAFESFEQFQEKFTTEATTQFGSGWAWLVQKTDGSLAVYNLPNQDSPYLTGDTPVLGLDVWEHAYYLDYLNDRVAYIQKWWEVVNWAAVEKRIGKTAVR